jgi:hypothetical protein
MDSMADHAGLIQGDDSVQAAVGPIQRPSNGPSPFEVPLTAYSTQPWTNRNVDLSQWFNYGLNPKTWTLYCVEQMRLGSQVPIRRGQ